MAASVVFAAILRDNVSPAFSGITDDTDARTSDDAEFTVSRELLKIVAPFLYTVIIT